MRALAIVCLVAGLVSPVAALDPGSPEDVLTRYLAAIKDNKPGDAYELISQAMRQGKSKEVWVKDYQGMMSMADVKIFDFKVYPGKIEGEKALVPNVLESQDRYVNTLGLTEHELYTLVREGGAWKVDSQILLEPAEVAKWIPSRSKESAAPPPSH
jgi:hypothetical protein